MCFAGSLTASTKGRFTSRKNSGAPTSSSEVLISISCRSIRDGSARSTPRIATLAIRPWERCLMTSQSSSQGVHSCVSLGKPTGRCHPGSQRPPATHSSQRGRPASRRWEPRCQEGKWPRPTDNEWSDHREVPDPDRQPEPASRIRARSPTCNGSCGERSMCVAPFADAADTSWCASDTSRRDTHIPTKRPLTTTAVTTVA